MRQTSRYSELVAANARAALARQGKTQRWLAAQTEISEPTLHRRLRGHAPFLAGEIVAVAEALGIPVTDLLPPVEGSAA